MLVSPNSRPSILNAPLNRPGLKPHSIQRIIVRTKMYDSKPAALLVDVETWNQTIQRLAQGDQASASIRSGRYDTEEEVDAGSQV